MAELNNTRFDFSQESDLKERLREQVQSRMKENVHIREEVRLDSIMPEYNRHNAPKRDKPTNNIERNKNR
jgi:hypothetical protein